MRTAPWKCRDSWAWAAEALHAYEPLSAEFPVTAFLAEETMVVVTIVVGQGDGTVFHLESSGSDLRDDAETA